MAESDSQKDAHWTPVGPHDADTPTGLSTFKHGPHQIVIVHDEDGEVRALDNRCPHEGYPLAQGDLKDCTLTCTWHNWKFDTRDGACLLGGEAVRSYPTRIRDGVLEVDLAPPDPAVETAKLTASVREGLFHNDIGRVTRDAVRLMQVGASPWSLIGETVGYDGRHAEYGSTHTLAMAADCGRFLEWHEGLDALYAIAPALSLCGDSNLRQPPRTVHPAIAGATAGSLRAAVEEEDVPRAHGLLRGAFESGVDRATIEGWLFGILSDHFTDFGHPLIYQIKLQEMGPHLQDEHWQDTLVGLLEKILLATREDTLPYMATYFARADEVREGLAGVYEAARVDSPFDARGVIAAVLDGTAAEAFESVWGALRSGVSGERVAEALVVAAAERVLRFDVRLEDNPMVAENWLWVTHRLTFAAAVRHAQIRFADPEALRFLFQAVAFVHSGRGMDLEGFSMPQAATAGDVDSICAAVREREPALAVSLTLAAVRGNGGATPALARALQNLSLEDHWVRPIFHAHAVKMIVAGLEETEALRGQADAELPLLAAVRFLASDVREVNGKGTVLTSIRWVAEGEMPRKLTQ